MSSFGTDEYIRQIVMEYSKTLYRIAFTTLRSIPDSEDIVQEVFLRLLKTRPQFASREHEKAWLIRVAVNLSRNRLRHSSRSELPLELCPESVNELVQDDFAERDGSLLQAVLALPEKYRTIIHLYYYEDYTIGQIAQILAIPSATVGTRLARGRAMLRKMLEGGYFGA
ncbi:MAG: RNA polymerase sigma factor [Ruminococcaceae bacterium]|nr:RNA polymerase sigma factor [Oscillospiraceae bacterium]